jgi:hypothetical protein
MKTRIDPRRQRRFFQIVKLWELRNGRVWARAPDDLARSANHVSKYDGTKADAFLRIASRLKAMRKAY